VIGLSAAARFNIAAGFDRAMATAPWEVIGPDARRAARNRPFAAPLCRFDVRHASTGAKRHP